MSSGCMDWCCGVVESQCHGEVTSQGSTTLELVRPVKVMSSGNCSCSQLNFRRVPWPTLGESLLEATLESPVYLLSRWHNVLKYGLGFSSRSGVLASRSNRGA